MNDSARFPAPHPGDDQGFASRRRGILRCLLTATAAIGLGIVISQAAAVEPRSGEQKCGADGSVLRYDASVHGWSRTVEPCDPDPRQRETGRVIQQGPPARDDEKCGPDGDVLRYDAVSQTWKRTVSPCH
jgi:hypothetical protein